MTQDQALATLAERAGIVSEFRDMQGKTRVTTPDTQRALLTANGIECGSETQVRDSLKAIERAPETQDILVESNQAATIKTPVSGGWAVHDDETGCLVADGSADGAVTLPPLPSGIYVLSQSQNVRKQTILVTPKRLSGLGDDRLTGLTLALYSVRSDRNTGRGDFRDLSELTQIAGQAKLGFLGINPVHNMGFADTQSFSPYSPSHRGFLNTDYIALDHIPGLETSRKAAVILAGNDDEFARLRASDSVLYQPHKMAHRAALERLYHVFADDAPAPITAQFQSFVNAGGSPLEIFASYEAKSEILGPDWRTWGATDETATDQNRVAFHKWLQWVADCQLGQAQTHAKTAGMSLGLYLDLAVGPRRDGAESWCEQDSIAHGVSVGAPPDHLSPEGQNWNLAAFAPRKLQSAQYGPLRRILAQTMRHAGVIRIDHVLGLARSFWIPDNGAPGTYIKQPLESLLAVIKIEAERHGTVVIGEDLGLVPDGFRKTLRQHGIYGYSVLQYEKDKSGAFRDPATAPKQVLSCFATHDTPTVKGFETGRDIDWWAKLDWVTGPAAKKAKTARGKDVKALRKFSKQSSFSASLYDTLARSPSAMVAAQLDDVLGQVEAQNLPGTIDQHPNWRRKYDTPLDELSTHPALMEFIDIMAAARRLSTADNKDSAHED
jgi:4-alpha-glucanotransferase